MMVAVQFGVLAQNLAEHDGGWVRTGGADHHRFWFVTGGRYS
jgi:hypothetical protein